MRVTYSLGCVLMLGTLEAWSSLRPVLAARLTVQERVALAFVALKALNLHDAVATVEAALFTGAGTPQAPFYSFMDQAAFWADLAEPKELEAYCLASFKAMARVRQKAFLEYVQRRQAAQ